MRTHLGRAVIGLLLAGAVGCAGAELTQEDAYRLGCPAIDSVVVGGSVGNKLTVAGLKKLRESGQLSPETSAWLDAAIRLLETADPNDIPPEARKLIVDGCAANGHPLRNLKAE